MHDDSGGARPPPVSTRAEPGHRDGTTLLPLTGIRAFAALWVLLHHLRGGIEQALPGWTTLHGILASGYLGVDLFAFLSGFVIAHTYTARLERPSPGAAGRYLWARLARIYPLHLFVLGLFLLGLVGTRGVGVLALVPSDERFWRQLLLLHGWGLETKFGWNVPSWTVSSELAAYLVFPLVAPLLGRVRSGAVAVGLAAAAFATTTAVMYAVGHPGFDAYLDWGVARIVGEFLVGCCLQRAWRLGVGRGRPWGAVSLAALATGVALSHPWPVGSVAAFATLVYALAQDGPIQRACFANRPTLWLGEISYSIYMLHWFVLTFGIAALGPAAQRMAPLTLAALLAAGVIAGAALTYTFVERPSRRWLRSFAWAGAPT